MKTSIARRGARDGRVSVQQSSRAGPLATYGADMDQRITIVTLGVHDLGRSRRFYEDLGWRGQAVEETGFFQAGGQALVLWGREKLAADSGVDGDGSTYGGIVVADHVRVSHEVDEPSGIG